MSTFVNEMQILSDSLLQYTSNHILFNTMYYHVLIFLQEF